MKILVVSNLYPPYTIGGYEIACRDFSQGLAKLGHNVTVLTSIFGLSGNAEESQGEIEVIRALNFNNPRSVQNSWLRKWIGIKSVYFDFKNFFTTYLQIKRSCYDIIYYWNLSFLSISPIIATHFAGKRFVFHLEDYWLTTPLRFHQQQNQGWLEESIKKVLTLWFPRIIQSAPFIAVSKCIFNYYLGLGMQGERGKIVYNGLIKRPSFNKGLMERFALRRLLYVGRIIEDKGLHLAVQALGELKLQGKIFELDVVGEFDQEGYQAKIKSLIREYELESQIRFLGRKTREETLGLYRKYQLVVVPSVWEEPFGLVVIEAMSQGCVPIVSDAGALPELVEHGQDGFIFEKNSANSLVTELKQIESNSLSGEILDNGLKALARRAKVKISRHFYLKDKVKEVEKFLILHITV